MELRSHNILERPLDNYLMTMSAVLTASNTRSGLAYPHPTLTKIIGKPTAVTLKTFTKELFTNARAIPCNHDGNHYGHLGMIIPDAAYQALNNASAWAAPANPGNVPTIANGTDGVTITNMMKTYEQNLGRHHTFLQVDNDLKQMIIAAVEHKYIAVQEDATLGFAQKTAKHLYDHLLDVYGVVKASISNENLNSSLITPKNMGVKHAERKLCDASFPEFIELSPNHVPFRTFSSATIEFEDFDESFGAQATIPSADLQSASMSDFIGCTNSDQKEKPKLPAELYMPCLDFD